MLLRFACLAAIALFPPILFADPQTPDPVPLDLESASEQQKLSYILGVEMHEELTRQGFVLDPDMVAQAIRDEQAGVPPNLSTAEYIRIVTIKREKVAEFEARWQALSDENLEAGDAFMKAKALEPGVVSTESGLLYKSLRPGTGAQPSAEDIARTHDRGTMLSGEGFDS